MKTFYTKYKIWVNLAIAVVVAVGSYLAIKKYKK